MVTRIKVVQAEDSSDLKSAGRSLDFRKSNSTIGWTVTKGRLSLLMRKLFNVLLYHAQQQGGPGKNAPIVNETSHLYYWVPLSDIVKNAAYDSKDTQLIKDYLKEMQSVLIEKEDDVQWISEHLISSVKLVNPAGLNKRGGNVWVGFSFPPETQKEVLSPTIYTKLSIYYQALLRSGASLSLYEICRRYASNPSHLTARESWEWWYYALSGNPQTEGLPEYKYFKRDTLKTAIAEVNAVTDLDIEMIEHKNGRKTESIQFQVFLKAQAQFDLPPQPVIDVELINRLIQLGLSKSDATSLCATHGIEKIKAAMSATKLRASQQNRQSLDSPVAYFRWALKQQIELIEPKKRVNTGNQAPSFSLLDKYLVERAKQARALFDELSQDEQETLIQEFKVSEGGRVLNLSKGLENKLVATAFSTWFAQKQWGNPQDGDLVEFAARLSL